jgi:hypothetical protein
LRRLGRKMPTVPDGLGGVIAVWMCKTDHLSATAPLTSLDQGVFDKPAMKDNQGSSPGKFSANSKDSRRDRLKLALRENLKRRKAQARGRDTGPSESADASLDDAGGEKPTS